MREKIKEIVLISLQEYNTQLNKDNQLELSEETIIFGGEGKLDSIDFVNFIMIVEENIFNEFNRNITIVDEKAFSKKYNPFANVKRLIDYIQELLEAKKE